MADRGRGRGRGAGGAGPGAGRGGGASYRGGRGGADNDYRGGRGGGGRGGTDDTGYRGGRGRGRGYGYGDDARGGGGGGGGGGGQRGGGAPGFRGGRGGGARPVEVFSPQGTIPAPAARVTTAEDTTLAGDGSLGLGALGLATTFPLRPKFGTAGTPVILWANYVELIAPAKPLSLYRYDISVSPDVKGKKLSQVLRLALQARELAPVQNDIVTDLRSTLLSRQRLAKDDVKIEVTYRAEGEDEPLDNAKVYTVRLVYTNTLDMADLVSYLTSTDSTVTYEDKAPMLQALNIFLKHKARFAGDLVTIGSSKVFSMDQHHGGHDLGIGLTAIRGFFSSVRAATARLLVNVNVSHAAFYTAGPLAQLVSSYTARHRGAYKLNVFVKRLRLQTNHLPERRNKRGEVVKNVKSVFGLATPNDGRNLEHPPNVGQFGAGPKQVEFWLEANPSTAAVAGQAKTSKKAGKQPAKAKQTTTSASSSSGGRYITVYDHFQKTYGTQMNLQWPVINVGTRDHPSYLPLEVCTVVPGQPAMSKLDPKQTQEMIAFAVRPPVANAASIVNHGLAAAGLDPRTNVLLQQFGFSTSPNLITVPGRVLNAPKVLYGRNQAARVAFGSWNMAGIQFSTGSTLKNWSYLNIKLERSRNEFGPELERVILEFTAALNATGVRVPPHRPGQQVTLGNLNADDPQIDEIMARAAAQLDLLFIILPETNTPLYNRIKYLGDVKHGIHTVCVVGTKLLGPKGRDQYFGNVSLKFNLKLGGNNQLVDASRLGLINEDKTMVVGIDVTHPSPGSSTHAPSVAGMVASVDKSLGQWPAILSIQAEARQEMVTDLTKMLESRLKLWKTIGKHTSLPENILVYRDGVSEGQYSKVTDEELPLLREACQKMYPAADQKRGLPRFTIIIVGKRHHTRFYPTKVPDADRSSNTKPGTVVDRGVTEARNWDFFLQAHAALQGTARPAHYYIVLDEIFRARYGKVRNVADIVEDITQSMCYTYGRATKAVSLCTPAYYADIVCERARRYLSGLFDPSSSAEGSIAGSVQEGPASSDQVKIHSRLENTMFYI